MPRRNLEPTTKRQVHRDPGLSDASGAPCYGVGDLPVAFDADNFASSGKGAVNHVNSDNVRKNVSQSDVGDFEPDCFTRLCEHSTPKQLVKFVLAS